MHGACGVIDENAPKKFQTISKSENHMQNSDCMQKKLKMHACTIFAFENRSYLGEFEAEFKKALARE
jgi:hypothetical protein